MKNCWLCGHWDPSVLIQTTQDPASGNDWLALPHLCSNGNLFSNWGALMDIIKQHKTLLEKATDIQFIQTAFNDEWTAEISFYDVYWHLILWCLTGPKQSLILWSFHKSTAVAFKWLGLFLTVLVDSSTPREGSIFGIPDLLLKAGTLQYITYERSRRFYYF